MSELRVDTLNPAVVAASYAVRGPVLARALALQAQLATDPASLPFDEVGRQYTKCRRRLIGTPAKGKKGLYWNGWQCSFSRRCLCLSFLSVRRPHTLVPVNAIWG